MAPNEGGKLNLEKFYAAVVGLSGILIPGAIFTFLLCRSPFLPELFGLDELKIFLPASPAFKFAGYALASYIAGQFLAVLGYFVMDPLFEYYYVTRFPGPLRVLETQARAATSGVVDLGNSRKEQLRRTIAYACLYSPQALARMEAFEADCKFFRNLIPAMLISFPLIDSVYCLNSGMSATVKWFQIVLVLILLIYQGLWNRSAFWDNLILPKGNRLFARLSNSLFLLSFLWLAPMLTSLSLCTPTWSRISVNLGFYGLMLFAGICYMAFQRQLMTSAYEFLIILFSKRSEIAVSSKGPLQ